MHNITIKFGDTIGCRLTVNTKEKSITTMDMVNEQATRVVLGTNNISYEGVLRRIRQLTPQSQNKSDDELLYYYTRNDLSPSSSIISDRATKTSLAQFYTVSDKNHFVIDDTAHLENENMRGMQKKGGVIKEGSTNTSSPTHYIKLDQESLHAGGVFEDNPDVKYTSISEHLASLVLKNINNFNVPSAKYESGKFTSETTYQTITGSLSKNAIPKNFRELVLSSPHKKIGEDDQILNIRNYGDDVMDSSDEWIKQTIFSNIRTKNEDGIFQQLLQQSAFDILIRNTDRKGNPANICFLANVDGVVESVLNIDYGRSLQTNIRSNKLETPLFSSSYIKKHINQPLEFDVDQFTIDVEHYKRSIVGSSEYDEFARTKSDSVINIVTEQLEKYPNIFTTPAKSLSNAIATLSEPSEQL